jgi:hypothetical protein
MESAARTKDSPLTLSGEFRLRGDVLRALDAGVVERRAKPRILQPFPTKVRGKKSTGEIFEIDCAVDNISSSGVYLRLPVKLESGSQLELVIKFENGHGTGATARLLCQVLRNERQREGLYGLAMGINSYRFL